MARFAKKTSLSMGPKATALRTVRKLPDVSFSRVAIRSRLVWAEYCSRIALMVGPSRWARTEMMAFSSVPKPLQAL